MLNDERKTNELFRCSWKVYGSIYIAKSLLIAFPILNYYYTCFMNIEKKQS